MGPKEVPEESVPERDRCGVISTNVALVVVMRVQCTTVMRTREQSEMVVNGISEASAAAEVKWRLVGHGDGLFFEILHVDC
jgi:hypothetical protein